MNTWNTIPAQSMIDEASTALKSHGMEVVIVETKEAAKSAVLELIPKGAEVMTMSSATLEETGIAKEINESGKYAAVKTKLMGMDRATNGKQMQQLGTSPDWTVGSVHAVTQDGKVVIASNTGSQLPAYAYGSGHVIWVVGAQKLVANLDEAMKRLYEYTLPLESKRVQKAYGMPNSAVKKILIVNEEGQAGRITLVIVKEVLGY